MACSLKMKTKILISIIFLFLCLVSDLHLDPHYIPVRVPVPARGYSGHGTQGDGYGIGDLAVWCTSLPPWRRLAEQTSIHHTKNR